MSEERREARPERSEGKSEESEAHYSSLITRRSIEIHSTHPTLSLDEAGIREAVGRAVAGEGFAVVALSIVLADHGAVRTLNRDWLGHDFETDVVSFPLDDEAAGRREVDGEVYVDLDTAAERAPEFGVSFDEEGLRYVLHGLLHLMGHDDSTEDQRKAMSVLEERYLRRE